MRIELDDLSRPEVHDLLREHLSNMHELSPPESVHALDLAKLRSPDITFWTVWDGATLVGCGALKELDASHGEIKSMRTPTALRRRGAGRAVLAHVIQEARARGYARLSLETGAQEAFRPAQRLYESFGFTYCGPFGSYGPDPNSVFMTLALNRECDGKETPMIQGTCHCGSVAWQFDGIPESATACNCTVCRRYGVLWAYDYEGEGIRVTGPTAKYIRGKAIEFHFCPTCGCVAYWRAQAPGDDGRRRIAVNLRLTEPAPIAAVPIDHFDGLDTFEDLPRDGRCVGEYWF